MNISKNIIFNFFYKYVINRHIKTFFLIMIIKKKINFLFFFLEQVPFFVESQEPMGLNHKAARERIATDKKSKIQ